MSDLEALLWDLEAHDPGLRSTITVAVMFDRSPDPVAVVESVDRLTRCLPRLRDRVVRSPLSTAPPRWERDPDFDLGRHLIRVTAKRSVPLEDLLRAAEPVAAGPFAPDRPPWQMLLIDDPAGGGALIVKLHHTFTDGLGAVKLAAQLFDLERHPRPSAESPQLGDRGRPSTLARMWDDLVFEADRSVDVARHVVPWVADGIRDALLDPVPRARSTLELVQSLRRLAVTAARAGSPVLERRVGRGAASPRWRSRWSTCAMRLAGRAAPSMMSFWPACSVDFVCTTPSAARRRHQYASGYPSAPAAPVPTPTCATRSHRSWSRRRYSSSTRSSGYASFTSWSSAPAISRRSTSSSTPREILRRIPGSLRWLALLAGASDVMASNVPGSPVDLYLGGARVERLVPLGPRGGAGLNLTLLSHVESVHIGVNMDPVSIPDPGVLVDCLRAGFDETLA